MMNMPTMRTMNCRPCSRFWTCRTGGGLRRIIISCQSLAAECVAGLAKRESHGHGGLGRHVHDESRVELSVVDLDALERVQDLHRHADAGLDGLEENGHHRGTAREVG